MIWPRILARLGALACAFSILCVAGISAGEAASTPVKAYLPLEHADAQSTNPQRTSLSFVHAPTRIVQLASIGGRFLDTRTTVVGLRWHGWGKGEVTAGLQSITRCSRATATATWSCKTYRSHGLGLVERLKTFTCTTGGTRRTMLLYTSVFFQAGGQGWDLAPSGDDDATFADDFGCTRG